MTRKNRKKKVLGNFTNATDLQNRFFAEGEERRKAGDKKDGDSGYWNGGRCNWGGSHNLQEDSEALASFFNSAASIADDVGEIKLSANEQIFNQRKQALSSKIQGLINKCQTSDSYSIANICCIWNDYFGSFLKPFLDTFSKKLERQLGEVQKLEPKHQKELLQLEQEAKELESAYNENVKKANDPNTSPADKTKFLLLADQLAGKAKRLKQRISQNPLADLSRFSNLDELKTLLGGNIPKNPPSSKPKGGSNTSNGGGNNLTSNPLEDPQNFFEQNKTEIFVVIALIGVLLYIYTQKDTEDDEEAKENKKFMRQMMMMKEMNERNNSKNEE